jgi:hypothetical protein
MATVELIETPDQSVGARVTSGLRMARRYVTSLYRSRQERTWYQDIKTYCMFIGHARSGHSIVGALLDAHPSIILPDEVDALQYVSAGFSREQIYHLLLARSLRQANKGRTKGGRDGKTYSYQVPGQWQGRFEQLCVIGDSKAGVSTQRLARNPALFEQLQRTMKDVDVKVILVVRNPYDNISTMILRGGRTFENAIERYFSNCEALIKIRERVSSTDFLLIKQEDVIEQPQARLGEICRFLGVDAADDYLNACASILYKSPAQSRQNVQWRPELVDAVRRQSDQYDFLAGYSYEH